MFGFEVFVYLFMVQALRVLGFDPAMTSALSLKLLCLSPTILTDKAAKARPWMVNSSRKGTSDPKP